MNKGFCFHLVITVIFVLQIFSSCRHEPNVTTSTVTDIETAQAKAGGVVIHDGHSNVIVRGVCWSTSPNPTISDSRTSDGNGEGSFNSILDSLLLNTHYYVRAYGTNGVGTGYGKQVEFTTRPLTDSDGNTYQTVTIGTQVWMSENLKTTKYNDGTSIPLVTDGAAWGALTTPGYCWHNNDSTANKATYGALYNWFTVNTGKLCPGGWHVPTDAQWTTLTDYLTNNGYGYQGSGNDIGKSMAATSHWYTNSEPGSVGNDQTSNNSSGFTALPGGYRNPYTGYFRIIGVQCEWWSATEADDSSSWVRSMHYTVSEVGRILSNKGCGFSVRCVMN
jgi:uncharacterized protein (TIGR02145 family)